MLKETKLKSKKAEENQVQVVPKLEDFNKDIDKCETEREAVIADEESDIEMDETERKSPFTAPNFASDLGFSGFFKDSYTRKKEGKISKSKSKSCAKNSLTQSI
jgi:hypothetical protein